MKDNKQGIPHTELACMDTEKHMIPKTHYLNTDTIANNNLKKLKKRVQLTRFLLKSIMVSFRGPL